MCCGKKFELQGYGTYPKFFPRQTVCKRILVPKLDVVTGRTRLPTQGTWDSIRGPESKGLGIKPKFIQS